MCPLIVSEGVIIDEDELRLRLYEESSAWRDYFASEKGVNSFLNDMKEDFD
jgi:hypothetical protein